MKQEDCPSEPADEHIATLSFDKKSNHISVSLRPPLSEVGVARLRNGGRMAHHGAIELLSEEAKKSLPLEVNPRVHDSAGLKSITRATWEADQLGPIETSEQRQAIADELSVILVDATFDNVDLDESFMQVDADLL
jgi:hypothetical protein